ncbi:MAG TPA: tetratricopeptide repeat protein [bacterium]|nr:tetratricopeptide repeat protein [bacterium]
MVIPKNPSGPGSAPDAGATESPPPWLNALGELLDKIDPKDSEKALRDLEEFIQGDSTWAQVQGIPQQMLLDIAERGYLKFKSGRMKEAEILFKGLSALDHKTAYYHTALGAIYQKQENYLDALAEYTAAIELDPEDVTAYVNRGEIYYLLGSDDLPMQDFEAAIQLDPQGKDPWANRARFLKKQVLDERAEYDAAEKAAKG